MCRPTNFEKVLQLPPTVLGLQPRTPLHMGLGTRRPPGLAPRQKPYVHRWLSSADPHNTHFVFPAISIRTLLLEFCRLLRQMRSFSESVEMDQNNGCHVLLERVDSFVQLFTELYVNIQTCEICESSISAETAWFYIISD